MCQDVLTIYQVVLKEYHKCPFDIKVGERLVAKTKKGDHGNALKVIDEMHDRGQLDYCQRDLDDLAAPLWPLKSEVLEVKVFHSNINCILTCNFFG